MGDHVSGPVRKRSGDQTQIVFVDDERESPLDDVSFDEMNLVELPFALLTRNTDGIYEIPLSSDGKSRLACLNSSGHGLPNSLAPRVLLGLMWMWKNEWGDDHQTFSVKVRDLVVRYMYPGRFKAYAPAGKLLRSAERQVNCIANSRIHTDRWWDHKRKQRQVANISIISDVKVLDEGGQRRPRVLEVTWGKEFWKSMVRRYTKPIDAKLVQRLDSPLDLQLYRLLDRQLAVKPRQHYSNIVDFARYKLGMRGQTLDSGGRIASSYVVKKLSGALKRLSCEKFTVRMTVDRTSEPFAVTFERLGRAQAGQRHEVLDRDLAGDLVREFLFFAHGVPRDQRRTHIAERDRTAAKEWLEVYGFEKAKWMIQHCVRKKKERRAPDILMFRGLRLYESAADGAFEHHAAEKANQSAQRVSEEIQTYWGAYRTKLAEIFDGRTTPGELAKLEAEVRADLAREKPGTPAFILDALLRSRLIGLKSARLNALSEGEFRAHRSLRALRETLIERHAVDPLEASCAGREGEDALPAEA
jgi:hypothetical protein